MLIFITAFLSLIGLMVIHEFGHFILAKKFGVRVEEFGIGYPPRIFGKKIGETIYSLNLLPFGAFVKIYGEEERTKEERSFNVKPFWQKALIILGGVISFWVVSVILLSIVSAIGVPSIIEDSQTNAVNPRVQVVEVAPDSPAQEAGIEIGDAISGVSIGGSHFSIDKVKDFQEIIDANRGRVVILIIERTGKTLEAPLSPRVSPPEGEGAVGIAIVRTGLESYPWYIAPIEGAKSAFYLTVNVVRGWADALVSLARRKPTGVQVMGPVGIFGLFFQVGKLGTVYFLQFVAIISIFLALFNLIPIPITDGGKLLFLVIEKIRGKPINQEFDKKINAVFFFLLLAVAVWVTIQDVIRLF